MTPELETDRLRLRQWREDDWRPLATFFAEPKATNIMGGITDAGFAWRVIACHVGHWQWRGYGMWAIEHKASAADGLVGVAGIKPGGEVGYWIAAPFWSTGFATEALEAIVAFAMTSGIERLEACVFQDNPASARVLAKAGFTIDPGASTPDTDIFTRRIV